MGGVGAQGRGGGAGKRWGDSGGAARHPGVSVMRCQRDRRDSPAVQWSTLADCRRPPPERSRTGRHFRCVHLATLSGAAARAPGEPVAERMRPAESRRCPPARGPERSAGEEPGRGRTPGPAGRPRTARSGPRVRLPVSGSACPAPRVLLRVIRSARPAAGPPPGPSACRDRREAAARLAMAPEGPAGGTATGGRPVSRTRSCGVEPGAPTRRRGGVPGPAARGAAPRPRPGGESPRAGPPV